MNLYRRVLAGFLALVMFMSASPISVYASSVESADPQTEIVESSGAGLPEGQEPADDEAENAATETVTEPAATESAVMETEPAKTETLPAAVETESLCRKRKSQRRKPRRKSRKSCLLKILSIPCGKTAL